MNMKEFAKDSFGKEIQQQQQQKMVIQLRLNNRENMNCLNVGYE